MFLVDFINENLGVITLVVGFFAILLYIYQKNEKKRELARLIFQEIRCAEKHVKIARERNNVFLLTNKLLPTNSWYSNIHLFVNDFEETDRDSISDFYSKVTFLDRTIEKISDFKTSNLSPVSVSMPSVAVAQPATSGGTPTPPLVTQFQLSAEIILKDVADKVEFLYNTSAADKLRELAKRKWYWL